MTRAEFNRLTLEELNRRSARRWDAAWECYHFNVNHQARKTTIRNIIAFGFSARDAIEMVRDCEQEG